MKTARRRLISICLVIAMVFAMVPGVWAASSVGVPEGRVYITSTKYALVPGATETVLTTNNQAGTDQCIGFLMEFSGSALKDGTIKAVASYKDHQYENLGLQTVMDQAKAYEKTHKDETVIAGINGDFFNFTNGEPVGALVMDGTVYHPNNGRPYFAILKDGTAAIREGSQEDLSDVAQAIGGDEILVRDGVPQTFEGDYASLKYSRTALGIKADGTIVTYTTHGISVPTSCGETYNDLAKILAAQGCVIALNIDGGGSSTSISMREGTNTLAVRNSPSDGTPRTVSSAFLFASTVKPSGVFDHASLTPNNEYYTPSTADAATTVQFEASGVDSVGSTAPLPESGLTWALSKDSAEMGTIDASTGLFTAAAGKLGTVGVELMYQDKVVGETTIQLVEPEEISFSGTGVSLNFNDSSDLGLSVRGAGMTLNHKDGDFTWDVSCNTSGVDVKDFGTVTGNIFTSGPKQSFSMDGNVTVTYTKQDGTKISATIFVEVGKMPIVAMDFEDTTGIQGEDVVGLWDWGAPSYSFYNATENQSYTFKHYDTLYYLQSVPQSSDSHWINEIYETKQPWTENEDGTITVTYNGQEYEGTKEETYGTHGKPWVSFTDENGDQYEWFVYPEKSGWDGNQNNPDIGSASAILGADGYDMYVWHTSANPSNVNGPLHGEGSKIVDASTGEVRFGEHALKLTYDYRNFSPTGGTKNCNTYYRVTNPLTAQGSPTGFGMWVYAPEGMSNFWFWTQISYWNGESWTSAYIHFKPAGAEKTLQYTGINWTGWTYVEADLSSIYSGGAVVDADHPIQIRSGNPMILMTYIPGGTSDGNGNAIVCGSKSEGYFYIDNVRWVYGTNVDDMDAPQIITAKANDTALSTKETTALTSNDISFYVEFTDPQGENYSGIDESATQVFLDGAVLPSAQFTASADRLQTQVLSLANGEHTLEVQISDNFGNKTNQVYNLVVNNPNSTIPTVTITRGEGIELGGNYKVSIQADSLENIASVSTNITYDNAKKVDVVTKYLENNKFYDDYGNELTQGADGNYYDASGNLVPEPIRPNRTGDYQISSGVQTLGENLTGSIRNKTTDSNTRAFTATATVKDTVTKDNTILTFDLPIPSTLTAVDKLPVTITVSYTTKDGNTYTITTGKVTNSVYAYYSVSAGIQISGAESGDITVTANDGSEVDTTNLKVYDGTTEITGTWNGNVFTTAYFTGKDANYTSNSLWVADEVNKHYSFNGNAYVCAYPDAGAHDITLNATTGDSTTTQQLTWISGSDTDTAHVQVQYLTKAAYDAAADKDAAFADATSVSGTSDLTDFILGGVDYTAAYINNVTITGLTPGTEYVCRGGDGKSWSNVTTFSTQAVEDSVKFMVMGDAQLHGNDEDDAEAIESLKAVGENNKDINFGVQCGDFVDGGTNYTQWEQILRQYGSAFPGIDFVHTMGNHEVYTSNGTPGATISQRLYGLTDSENKYYSVEYGDVYIAVINQTATTDLADAAAWLVEDAAKTDCTWKVLVTHQPVYYTNPNGSSDGHNKILAPACDEAGIDFVFGGHDHAYARTEQMKAGTPVDYKTDKTTNSYVDADGNVVATKGQGTVYMISGSMDPGGEYPVVDNADFHFAKATNEYNCIYISVEADAEKFSVNTYDMSADGTSELIDTYTMYTGTGICAIEGQHIVTPNEALYNPETGKLVCERCGAELDPAEVQYTGFATSISGKDDAGDDQYYLYLGALKTGWFTYGTDFMYANDKGLIDHSVVNYSNESCTESGRNMAYSPRYNLTYTGGVAKFTGHNYEKQADGTLVCTNKHYVTTDTGYAEVACEHTAIDIANWNFSLAWTSCTYNGTTRLPKVTIQNPATGETLEYATDGMGKLTDYTRVWANNKYVGVATVAVDANSRGDYFNSKGTVTLEMRINPAAPTGLTATGATSNSVDLSWNAISGTTKGTTVAYKVYVNKNGKWSLLGTTNETKFTATGLNHDTEYSFAVRAVATVPYGTATTNLTSGYSDAASATTKAGTKLNATMKLSYTKATYNGTGKRPVPTVTAADGTVLTKGVDYTVTYSNNVEVGVATVTVTGYGAYTGEITANFTIVPDVVTNLTAVRTGDSTAIINWTAAGCKDPIYQIYQSADNGASWKKIADVTDSTSFEATGLTATGDYLYRIRTKAIVNGASYWSMGYTDAVKCDNNHKHTEVVKNAKDPTCTEPGYTGDTVCSVCGVTIKTGTVIPATGHTEVVKNAKDPTCTEKGYTGDTVCSVCGVTIKTGTEIPAAGHKYDGGVVTVPATETTDGVKTFTCTVCGATYTEKIPAIGTDPDPKPDHPFTDVDSNAFYYDAMLWAVENGVTTGVTATEFMPKADATRAQFVTFLWRMAGEPEPTITEHSFTDVKEGTFYYKAMLWAVEKGITKGVTKTTFQPYAPVNRGQAVTFLWRYAGEPEPTTTEHNFTDVKEGTFYYKAMLWAVENDITNGITKTTFQPLVTANRGQVVTFLYRYNQNVVENKAETKEEAESAEDTAIEEVAEPETEPTVVTVDEAEDSTSEVAADEAEAAASEDAAE